jgi:plasmid replication initiation protein
MSDQYIKQSNIFTSAKFDYTSYEINFLMLLIREVNKATSNKQAYTIDIHEFLVRSKLSNNSYSYVKECLVKLRSKTFCFFDDDRRTWVITGIIDRVEIPENYGVAHCYVNDRIYPLLAGLRSQFTLIDLSSIFRLKSKYSKRIYQFCRQFLQSGSFIIEIEDLRRRLKIEKAYPNYADLKRRVIMPAVSEINEYTPLILSYSEIKRGRSVHQLQFHIDSAEAELFTYNQEEAQLKARLSKYKLAPWFVTNIIKILEAKEIFQVCYDLDLKLSSGGVENMGAYVYAAFVNRGVPERSI